VPQTSKAAVAVKKRYEELGDFTTTSRALPISLLAMVIGALCAFVALILLRLIGLFTNLFYFGRWNTTWRVSAPSASAATESPKPSNPF
jgi:hypothetical protein